jgi:murein tripeptide amidase MpaA
MTTLTIAAARTMPDITAPAITRQPRPCRQSRAVIGQLVAVTVLAGTIVGAQEPAWIQPPDVLPPVSEWHGASEQLIAAPGDPWITPSEVSGLSQTPGYAETIRWLERLDKESTLISLQEFGQTAQGRPLYLVIASSESEHTPQALRRRGRATLLVQAGIHAGEIDGKDAGLMMLRDLAFGSAGPLLKQVNLLFIPALNADGHERISAWNRPNQRGPDQMGWRTTAQNLNLNRDYVKADAPEMRALLTLLNDWPVTLYLDTHTTDGLDYQYDVTYAYHGRDGAAAWSPRVGEWLDRSLSPAVDKALTAAGHVPLNFYISPMNRRDLSQGLSVDHFDARYSNGYGDLRHVPTVLIETHSLKPYRQRVLGTRVLIEAALKRLAEDGSALSAAIQSDEQLRSESVILTWTPGGPQSAIDFLGIESEFFESPVTGGREVRWLGRPKLHARLPLFVTQPGLTVRRPGAYIIPATKPEMIDRLKLHGVRMEDLPQDATLEVMMYRLESGTVSHSERPIESRHPVRVRGLTSETRREMFPAGSVRVSTDQPLGDLAIQMLEPQGADSLLSWGFCPEIFQRTEYIEGYVMAPLAERMLATDARLKTAFEEKLKSDAAFAADPDARMRWLYEQTPFADDRYLLYPVGVELAK